MTTTNTAKMLSGESAAEALQQLILATLDTQTHIPDTTALCLDGTTVDQQAVLGVLKRLKAHEVLRNDALTWAAHAAIRHWCHLDGRV